MSYSDTIGSKIISRNDLQTHIARWNFKNQKIVFTNGCFDILHVGHVEYLSKAADLGDVLIVGLNSDSSVSRLKGEGRPINTQDDRAFILASLRFIDAVVVFEEDTPEQLIKAVNPFFLVKGGDYTEQTIVGADFVKKNGGEVVVIPLVDGFSTTSILEKTK